MVGARVALNAELLLAVGDRYVENLSIVEDADASGLLGVRGEVLRQRMRLIPEGDSASECKTELEDTGPELVVAIGRPLDQATFSQHLQIAESGRRRQAGLARQLRQPSWSGVVPQG